jgi:CHAT domain-containing protein/tetratricopeptide (TPR) repeat protein
MRTVLRSKWLPPLLAALLAIAVAGAQPPAPRAEPVVPVTGPADPGLAQVLVGAARWESRGEQLCPWLEPGARPVELLIQRGAAADSLSMLVLDRQHTFDLRPIDTGGYVATPIETYVQHPPGRVQLPGDGAAGVAELSFTRAGDSCHVRLVLPAAMRRVDSPADVAQTQERLRAMAGVARSLSESIRLLRQKNDAKGALVLARAAFDQGQRQLGKDEPLTAAVAAHLASVYWNLGDNRQAHELASQAVATFTAAFGPEGADTLETRKNVALYVWELGDLATARAEFERLRPLILARFGERSNVALAVTNNLAGLHSELGLVQEALDMTSFVYLAREARDGPNDRRTLVALNNLAIYLDAVGRDDDARRLYALSYERHKAALGPRDPDTLRAQHNLGTELCGDLPPDCALLQEAVRVKTEVLGADHPETLYSRRILGNHRLDQGRAAEALPDLDAVYRAQEQKMGARHWWTQSSLALAGRARALSADPETGVQQLRQAIDGLESVLGTAHSITLGSYASLAQVCERVARPACQRSALDTLVDRAEGDRGLALLRGQQQVTATQKWVPAYRSLARLQAAEGDFAAAVRTLERSKARGLLATLGFRSAERLGGLPPEATERILALQREQAALDDERNRATDAERLVQIEIRQSTLARELAQLRTQLRARFPKYAAASQVDVPDAAELARALVPDELFVGYAAQADGFLVYTADARAVLHVQHLPLAHARSAVEAWRSTIGMPGQTPLWRLADGSFRAAVAPPAADARRVQPAELAEHLAKALLEPLRERLARYRSWVISPDGPLATLPFETLPWNGALLADAVDVRYAQSLAVYRLLRQRPVAEPGSSLFAMGGPTFAPTADAQGASAASSPSTQLADKLALRGAADVSTLVMRSANDPQSTRRAYAALGMDWPPLPGAEREARAVAALFPGAVVFTGNDATEERLQQMDASGELARYRYLLFATHGYLSTEAPALSAVVLRQPGSARTDGYVTAAEWAGYTLRSDLTVLSACETGLGKEVAGEGVMGLPYALFVAGNRNTLLSLWKVPDASTAEFMIRFFRKLRSGTPQVTALAQTKREMAATPRYKDPLHWAGFVLYGS